MPTISNRPISDWPHLIGKKWDDLTAREIQDFFSRLVGALGGVPGEFHAVIPSHLAPGTIGDSGDPSQGWAAADHEHPGELTVKGDLLTIIDGVLDRLGVGTDGQVLTAKSTTISGLLWAPAATSLPSPSGSTETIQINPSESYAIRDIITKHYR